MSANTKGCRCFRAWRSNDRHWTTSSRCSNARSCWRCRRCVGLDSVDSLILALVEHASTRHQGALQGGRSLAIRNGRRRQGQQEKALARNFPLSCATWCARKSRPARNPLRRSRGNAGLRTRRSWAGSANGVSRGRVAGARKGMAATAAGATEGQLKEIGFGTTSGAKSGGATCLNAMASESTAPRIARAFIAGADIPERTKRLGKVDVDQGALSRQITKDGLGKQLLAGENRAFQPAQISLSALNFSEQRQRAALIQPADQPASKGRVSRLVRNVVGEQRQRVFDGFDVSQDGLANSVEHELDPCLIRVPPTWITRRVVTARRVTKCSMGMTQLAVVAKCLFKRTDRLPQRSNPFGPYLLACLRT